MKKSTPRHSSNLSAWLIPAVVVCLYLAIAPSMPGASTLLVPASVVMAQAPTTAEQPAPAAAQQPVQAQPSPAVPPDAAPQTSQEKSAKGPAKLSVEITSPLGRTGMTGPVRIVARIVSAPTAVLSTVQFYVDSQLVGEDKDGPPYAVLWNDSNPFEKRTIVVQVSDSLGNTAKDTVELKPLEINEVAQVSSVLLEPLVTDKNGRPVNGLTAANFKVSEDDIPQNIDLTSTDTIPATYTLLIDSSQSMSRRLDFVRDAASQLPLHLRKDDRVVVVPFSKSLGAVTGPTQDRGTIAGAIQSIAATGGTSILDCLAQAAKELGTQQGRHIIVLITDGYDENSKISFEDALTAVKETQTTVYVIAVGGTAGISLKGEDLLTRLATETGGRAFFPAREYQLVDIHQLIAADVQQRYVVSYTPENQRMDGGWRRVALTVSDPSWTVKVRNGYYAPPPPPVRPQIEMTVRDTNRELIDISPDDFDVYEDGVKQKIEGFEEALTPVSIMLALDASGSMKKDAAAVLDAARRFVNDLPPDDKVGVMLFADKPVLAQDLSVIRFWINQAVSKYNVGGGTALYDALVESLARLKKSDARTAIVLLTDGRDENNPGTGPGSEHSLDDVVKAVKDTGTTIYAIGLGPNVDKTTIETLADASGGEAYFPEEVSSLDANYKRILANIRRRYVISYTSTNSTHNGAWRKVEIRPKRDGLSAETKGGYFAPDDSAPSK